MQDAQHFTVQPCTHQDGDLKVEGCIHVDALSPVDAAERVLKEPLTVCGSPQQLRAKVWRLADDFTPVSVLLYRAQS